MSKIFSLDSSVITYRISIGLLSDEKVILLPNIVKNMHVLVLGFKT